jgi:very-short-patch-repair endonuclease
LLAAIRAGGLPEPVTQFRLPGRGAVAGLADLAYPDAKLLIEADGRRWHARVRDFERDRARDAETNRAGWVTQRFSYEQITTSPDEVVTTIAAIRATRLAQLGRSTR